MKHSEAKVAILELWDRWIQTQNIDRRGPTGRHSLKFFYELQDAKSLALNFQSRGQDRWQIIHGWLLDEERLSDLWKIPARSASAPPLYDKRNGSGLRRLAGRRVNRR
jgi:hypothetical protein